MLLRRIVALSLLAVSTTAMADTIDFNLRDTSAQFQYKSSMGRDALGNTEFHLGVLYVNRNNLLSDFGLLVKDELGGNAPGFSVGVGIKGLVARVKDGNPTTSNGSALALGGLVRYSPPAIPRLGIVGQVYLSPHVVSFGDVDRYAEAVAQMEYEVIPQSAVYLGYRRIGFGLRAQPYTILDEGVHLGVRISF
jgi:hypothetical protein